MHIVYCAAVTHMQLDILHDTYLQKGFKANGHSSCVESLYTVMMVLLTCKVVATDPLKWVEKHSKVYQIS